jgi:signal recognition particle GTPase
MSSAASRDADLVLVDTAGRLHTKTNLMAELEKLKRIVDRTPGALKEVLLVLDATTGQNGLTQARQFAEAVEVTGVVLTKLDGSAKGGIVLAIEAELGIPVKLMASTTGGRSVDGGRTPGPRGRRRRRIRRRRRHRAGPPLLRPGRERADAGERGRGAR